MIETTKVGIVNNALSYITGSISKSQFVYNVIIGLGSNSKYDHRREFTTTVMSAAGERGTDANVLLNFFDVSKQVWSSFVQDVPNLNFTDF